MNWGLQEGFARDIVRRQIAVCFSIIFGILAFAICSIVALILIIAIATLMWVIVLFFLKKNIVRKHPRIFEILFPCYYYCYYYCLFKTTFNDHCCDCDYYYWFTLALLICLSWFKRFFLLMTVQLFWKKYRYGSPMARTARRWWCLPSAEAVAALLCSLMEMDAALAGSREA